MKTFIGGLLVLSLLSNQVTIETSASAYEVFRSKKQIVYIAKKENGSDEIEYEDINEIIDEIESDVKNLNGLIKEKTSIISRIKTAMDFKAYSKTRMSPEQISEYRNYTNLLNKNDEEINDLFTQIEARSDLEQICSEIIHTDTDIGFVYQELATIDGFQKKAIESLEKFLNSGYRVLSIL